MRFKNKGNNITSQDKVKQLKPTYNNHQPISFLLLIHHQYQTFLKGEGTGYFEARKHLTLITEIGQPVTDAMQVLGKNNEELRDIHTKLSIIDAEVNVRQSADAQGASVDKGSAEVVTEEVDNSAE